jgi:hypothetical protein
MKLKPMIYLDYNSKKNCIDILAKGKTEEGFYWFIRNIGTHPTAYIGIPKEHKYYGKHYEDISIEVHGGLTFSEEDFMFNPIQLDIWWIGWDYAHYGDYTPPLSNSRDTTKLRKWTTEEIYQEVLNVIEQLKVLEE